MDISKETILQQLFSTSTEISAEIDKRYSKEIDYISEELAVYYKTLKEIIDRGEEDQAKISDADFQSALLFWTGLNTYLSAVELFRKGYTKEPPMLIRNVLETISAAYDIHIHPEKLTNIGRFTKNFDSKKSINIVKKISPLIAKTWGMLSGNFSHVSYIHTMPNMSAPVCIGGIYDPKHQVETVLGVLPSLMVTLDLIGSVIELSFIKELQSLRFWEMKSHGIYENTFPDRNRKMTQELLSQMSVEIQKIRS